MFDSQALTTAIGLSLLFFVMASGASAIAEALSRLLQKRAKDLEATLRTMLSGTPVAATDPSALTGFAKFKATVSALLGGTPVGAKDDALTALQKTAVLSAAQGAARQARYIWSSRARPAYLSARAFADAVTELLADDKQPMMGAEWAGLRKRILTLEAEAAGDLLHVKAGLESWFDETMARLADAYKRWATVVLFFIGLLLAGFGNVSAIVVAQTLWLQPVVREAAVNAAEQVVAKGTPSDVVSGDVQSVTDLGALGLPVGWSTPPAWSDFSWDALHVGGWLLTALLLMLGAPFWFDALSRLVSLRTAGAKPAPAAQDQASATSKRGATAAQPTSAIVNAIRALPWPPDDTPPPTNG